MDHALICLVTGSIQSHLRATNTWFEAIIVEIITLESRDRVHVHQLTRMQLLNN